MKSIKFLSDQIYDTGAPGRGPAFAAGSVLSSGGVAAALGYDVTPEYADGFLDRWVRRNVAAYVEAEAAPAAPETDPQPEPVEPVRPVHNARGRR